MSFVIGFLRCLAFAGSGFAAVAVARAAEPAGVEFFERKVRPVLDAELERDFGRQVSPAVLSVAMRDGTVHRVRKDHPCGSPEDPMGRDALAAKFRRCAAHAVKPLARDRLDALVGLVGGLESVTDMREVVRLLA